MRTIYFSELLELIRKGTNPSTVWHNHQRFDFDNVLKAYTNKKNRVSLMEARVNSTYGKNVDIHDVYIDDVFNDFWVEYIPDVLDSTEKEYIYNVVKPFIKDVKYISKRGKHVGEERRWIEIVTYNNSHTCLPVFSEDTNMYSGMKEMVEYTLEELGI